MKILYGIIIILIIGQTISIEEVRIDMREYSKTQGPTTIKDSTTNHKFNLALPYSQEWFDLMKDLFYNQIGENSLVMNPLTVVVPKNVTIGKDATVMNGALMMAAGGITIEDKVIIAAHSKLISNNHDPYDRAVLTCKPILIKEGAWIGAAATILPGVTVGRYAIVGSDSVVTKDVPDYAVVVGNPAKIIKFLDKDKFEKN
jgi:acetyltransferase-like isoleucine patch superfamily enzyme